MLFHRVERMLVFTACFKGRNEKMAWIISLGKGLIKSGLPTIVFSLLQSWSSALLHFEQDE
jgi:hypothetical protein